MRISKEEFIDVLFHDCSVSRTHPFAFWKLKALAMHGETYYLPETGCYYGVYDGFLFRYISKDGKCHLPAGELNQFRCIAMTEEMFQSIQDKLEGFQITTRYKLHYDYDHPFPPAYHNFYVYVPFEFPCDSQFTLAAQFINQGKGERMGLENMKKMTYEPVFDSGLWLFVRRRPDKMIVGAGIATYDPELEETDIEWLYVHPVLQHQGAGRYLLGEILRRSKYRSKDICVSEPHEFFKRCGFVEREATVYASKEGYTLYAPFIQPDVLP